MERRKIAIDIIIIDGIPENKTENCAQFLQKIGKELNLNINDSVITDRHRIGFNRNNVF